MFIKTYYHAGKIKSIYKISFMIFICMLLSQSIYAVEINDNDYIQEQIEMSKNKIEIVNTYMDIISDEYVQKLLGLLEIMTGYDDGLFHENDKVTRAQMAAISLRLLNESPSKDKSHFNDVNENHWATYYISRATELGLMNGIGDNNFAPDSEITNLQAGIILCRLLGFNDSFICRDGYNKKAYIEKMEFIHINDNTGISDTNSVLTRNNIARMIYNILYENFVEDIGRDDSWLCKEVLIDTIIYKRLSDSKWINKLDNFVDFFKNKYIPEVIVKSTVVDNKIYKPYEGIVFEHFKYIKYATEVINGITLYNFSDFIFEDLGLEEIKTEEDAFLSILEAKATMKSIERPVNSESNIYLESQSSYENAYKAINFFSHHDSSKMNLYVNYYGIIEMRESANEIENSYTTCDTYNVAHEIIKELINNGTLSNEMTQTEMAKELYKWVINHMSYTNCAFDGQSGYIALTTGEGVCAGYTRAYNILCNVLGIPTIYSFNIMHAWSITVIDGKKTMIDTTFGDSQNEQINYDYFDFWDNKRMSQDNGFIQKWLKLIEIKVTN